VYGHIQRPPASEEYGPLLPLSVYGAAKLAAEGLISSYCDLFGISAWIFRFGNVIGARMSHGIIYDFINRLRANPKTLTVLGDGGGEKNYFLVEECISGMLFAYQRCDVRCEIFNLGTRSTSKVMKIANIIIEEMELSSVEFEFTGGVQGWPGDQPVVLLDVSKMTRLGWQALYLSDEAVRIATRRYLGKPDLAQPAARIS
jgi:UDP-glucose 4-epimerase